MKRTLVITILMLAALGLRPAPARADLTAFYGLSPKPDLRSARGIAIGISLIVVGFEFEYSNTAEDLVNAGPGLRTGMLNGLVQTPTSSMQFYLTAGGGFYRENYRDLQETSFGTNIGGGVKMKLAGPLRLRLDYRVFSLRGDPVYSTSQRFYAGANIAF
jgi:hypothetical protein